MKKLIAVLCVGLVVGAVAEVEYGYFIRSSSLDDFSPVTLNAGDTLTILLCDDWSGDYRYDWHLRVEANGTTSNLRAYTDLKIATGVPEERVVVGPCTVVPADASPTLRSGLTYLTYKITRPDTIVETSPMNIISLPDDNNGDVELLVESSIDLQNWTPVYSGSAGTSNDAAFFRTRLIQN